MATLNESQKEAIKTILGRRLTITPAFELDRDFFAVLTREQLRAAVPVFGAPASDRLLRLGPTEEDWLVLARRGDETLSKRAKRALIANPAISDQALEYLLLAGTKKTPERKKAFEVAMARPPNAKLLRNIFPRFKKGPEVKAAWKRFSTLPLDVDELQRVLKHVTDREVLDDAWGAFLAKEPSSSDVAHVLCFCHDRQVRNRAGGVLVNDPATSETDLGYVIVYASDQRVLEAAARRLLANGKKGAADIATRLKDKTLAFEGWKRFNRRQGVELRNMVVSAVRPDIRALAFALAKPMRWPEHDLDYLRTAKESAVRRAFGAKK